jgi:anthranilate phosphoribosyltransferase
MKEVLQFLFDGNHLTRGEARDILKKIGSDNYSDIEISSFLTVFLMRPITPDELKGFRDALLDLCIKVDLSDYNTIDVCGTGGDEKNTFNISTLSAFVLAGAGIKVAKHGNYGISSSCGSSNLLEYFGYRFSNDEKRLQSEIEEAGITFMHAPLFHPAMKFVAPVRRALKVKTFFNKLGPLVNPSFPRNQMAGVYNMIVFDLYYDVFNDSGINYTIIHSHDGFDEISLTGDFSCATNFGKTILSPRSFGFSKLSPADISGGTTVEDSASIFIKILKGEGTPGQINTVLANSAIGIRTVYPEKKLEECVEIASESLTTGKALKSFNLLLNR